VVIFDAVTIKVKDLRGENNVSSRNVK